MITNNLIGSGGGGGGCFPAGTLVSTPTGPVPIEKLQVGDKVISFDQAGVLCEDTVQNTHVHTNELVWTYVLWNLELRATPNHWVLNQYNAFVEIDTLTTEDCLVDFMGHMRPMLNRKDCIYEAVYNLTVKDNHTFIANGIRVHNGGKGIQEPIIGSGGGGGGGKGGGGSVAPRQSIIDPDSLNSKQYARVLDLVCEGEVQGLADGYKSVYFDGTPLMSQSGEWNFGTAGLSIETRNGTQSQTPMSLFTQQEVEISTENREVTYSNSYTLPSITENYIDLIRLNFVVPRLSYTNTTNGDVSGTTVEYKISLQEGAGSFYDLNTSRTSGNLDTWCAPDTTDSTTSVSFSSEYATINVSPWVNFNSAHVYNEGTYTVYMGAQIQYRVGGSGSAWTDSGVVTTLSTTYKYTPQAADQVYGEYGEWVGFNQAEASIEILETAGTTSLNVSFPYYGYWEVRLASYYYPWQIADIEVVDDKQYYNRRTHSWHSYSSYWTPAYAPVINKVWFSILTSTTTISGKASNPYRFSQLLDVKGKTFPINIKVTRLTADSASQYLNNKIIVESFTKIATERMSYPNSALVGIQLDATQFTSIPTRVYDMYLMKVKVPDGYNPYTRSYPTIWSGGFVTSWTDNPAWVFYDLCTNSRYGLGNYIDPKFLDVFQLYSIAKYCDELIDDGFGGKEPRYTCNLYIQTREEAYKVISNLAALFSSIVYWGVGTINILSDKSTDTTYVFTNANVEDGAFNYSSSSLKSTHTVALVSYIDKTNNYKPAIEYVEDTEGVEKFGIKEVEVVAYGCTSRGQAHRLGRRMLLTEKLEGELVSFRTGLGAAYCRPGAVIKIQDNTIGVGNLSGGRILDFNTTTITLDREITLEAGITYQLSITTKNNKVKTIAINNTLNTTNTITISNSNDYLGLEAAQPMLGSIWVLNSSEVVNYSYWRVLSLKEADDLIFEISCIKYEPTKNWQIETGVDLAINKPLGLLDLEVPKIPLRILNPKWTAVNGEPTEIDNIVLVESLYRVGKADIATRVNIAWQDMKEASEYRVRYKSNNNNWVTKNIGVPYFELNNAQDGDVYKFELYAVNVLGRLSAPTTLTHTVVGKLAPPQDVTGLVLTRSSMTAVLKFNEVTDIDLAGYEVRYYIGTTVKTWEQSTALVTGLTSNRVEILCNALAAQHNFLVKAYDTTGNWSLTAATANFTITVPSAPSVTSAIVGPNAVIKVFPAAIGATQLDIADYTIRHTDLNWGQTTNTVTKGKMDNNIIPIDYAVRTYYTRVTDIAGNISSYVSNTITVTTLSAVTSITKKFRNSKVYLNWTPPTLTATNVPISYYKVFKDNTLEANKIAEVTDATFDTIIDWEIGTARNFIVVPIDTRGPTWPGASNTYSVNTIIPQAVEFVPGQVKQVGTSLLVDWYDLDDVRYDASPKTTLPIKHYEVRLNGADYDSGTYLGVTVSSSFYIPLSVPGTMTIRVKGYDTNNTEGIESITTYVHTVPAVVTNLTYTFTQEFAKLTWSPPASIALPIDKYEIRYAGAFVGFTYGSTFNIKATWTGARNFTVAAIDTAGNYGTEETVIVTVAIPTTPTIGLSFIGDSVQILISGVTSSLPITTYEVRRGGTSWGVGDTLISTTTDTTLIHQVNYTSTTAMVYRVKAKDMLGNVGAEGTSSITVSPPSMSNTTAQAVDNNVLLYWSATKGSLPIDAFEIRKGPSWDDVTTVSIGRKDGGFTTIFETNGGTYTYWIAPIDSAGNYGTPVPRAVLVAQPPDYIFRYKHDSTWNSFSPDPSTVIAVSKTNCAVDTVDNTIVGPIYLDETWATHFSTRAWNSIQDQITAGYSVYIQPSNTVASSDYIETIQYTTDTASAIASTKVSVSYSGIVIAGSPVVKCYISYKTLSTDSWSSEIEANEIFATNFRHIKVRINIAATTAVALYKIYSMSVKLDAKIKNDSGALYCLAEDAGGTQAVWSYGTTFADITSITTQARAIAIGGTITHSITDTTCTATCTSHNLQVGDKFYATFTGGTPPPAATYTVTAKTATTFTFTIPSGSGTGTTSIRIPVYTLYDFQDSPSPTGFKILLYDSAGARASGYASWAVDGY